jgi:hypothetical protein
MKLLVYGSTSYVARLIIPVFLDLGHKVDSIGRTHAELCEKRYATESLTKGILNQYDVFLLLAIDYEPIKDVNRFITKNLDLIPEIPLELREKTTIIFLGSDSASHDARSRYGKMKFLQSVKARNLGYKELRVGWLVSRETDSREVNKLRVFLSRIPVDFVPILKVERFNITSAADLVRDIVRLASRKSEQFNTSYSYSINASAFLGSDRYKLSFPLLKKFMRFSLVQSPKLYFCLPRKIVRILDSAQSLV